MPVRVLGKCGGYDSDILVGMQWAAGVYSASELASLGLPANADAGQGAQHEPRQHRRVQRRRTATR